VVMILTIVTQIGGLVFLVSMLAFRSIDKRIEKRWLRLVSKTISFLTLYLLFTFFIVPFTAKSFGRVQLPVFQTHSLRPGNILTCVLNRNYVRPELREIAFRVAEELNKKYPDATLNYLDANFPFLNKFPLFPHLSHNDGRKLDLAFQYNDSKTGKITSDIPSFIGYGICEEPKKGEENKPEYCDKKGYWQYNLLRQIISQHNKEEFTFDNTRNRDIVNMFASHDRLGKIFIEPHLKTRLAVTSDKVRFHGCQAVRHDDHIHVQLK
jgi:hypothetical protein